MYEIVKNLHVACAVLSISGFALRGAWMLMDSPLLQKKPVKILPHIVDTVFLAAGLTLAVITSQYPGPQGWLTAKVVGLVVYILLGLFALKLGKTKTVRLMAFILALATFAYVYGVAIHRHTASWMVQ
ncbi:MAG: SirB2 family protein [Pseudomonadota bacterium]